MIPGKLSAAFPRIEVIENMTPDVSRNHGYRQVKMLTGSEKKMKSTVYFFQLVLTKRKHIVRNIRW